MYCNRCNVEFPEGLRYCKWCGQELASSRRVTSELRTCASCSVAVHPDWTFCKACGVRLVSAAPEPAQAACGRCGAVNDPSSLYCSVCGESLLPPGESDRPSPTSQPGTAIINHCESCGEILESLTGYCKMCGAAAQPMAHPFGASSLLCAQCQSYSPIGSTSCRVCGALLIETEDIDVPEKTRSSTLPDLADRMPNQDALQAETALEATSGAPLPETDITSGEHTAIFPESEAASAPPADKPVPPRSAFETVETRIPNFNMKPQSGAETGVLPGVAGAASDPVSTTHLSQSRTTGPVDSAEASEQAPASGELLERPVESTERHPAAPAEDKNATIESELRLTRSIYDADEDAATGFNKSMPTSAQGSGFTAPFGLDSSALEQSWQDGQETRNISQPETETLPAGREVRSQADKPTLEIPGLQEQSQAGARYGEHEAQIPETDVLGHSLPPATTIREAPQSPPKRSNLPVILSLVALLLIGAAGYAAWQFLSPDPRTQPQTASDSGPATVKPEETAPPAPAPTPAPSGPVAPQGMVLVPGGTYTIGRDGEDNYESPAYSVELPAFFIDRTEVTNAAYKAFVDATGHEPPGGWNGGTFPEGRDNNPVTGVSWRDAVDYAKWAGKRLPTEEEWEAAARGTEGRIYPWGDEWKTGLANIGTKRVTDVGQFPTGASPSGALDMIGNVWEWTADEFHLYPGNTEQAPENIKQASLFRIIRGGAYDGSRIHTATYRGFVEADSRKYDKTGFRCAMTVAGSGK